MLLGRNTPVVQSYAPELLHAIPRDTARRNLGLGQVLPFHGVDLWHAYEMSWLDDAGKPVVRVGRFGVPADSPNIVESKSFKLYLNSLNSTRFPAEDDARRLIIADISATAGKPVTLELMSVDATALAGSRLVGACLDSEPMAVCRAAAGAVGATGRGGGVQSPVALLVPGDRATRLGYSVAALPGRGDRAWLATAVYCRLPGASGVP